MKDITDRLNSIMANRIKNGCKYVFVGSDIYGVIAEIYHGENITEIFKKLYKDNKINKHEIISFLKFDEDRERGYLDITEDDMRDLIKFKSKYQYNIMNF